jgi:spermidine synthase
MPVSVYAVDYRDVRDTSSLDDPESLANAVAAALGRAGISLVGTPLLHRRRQGVIYLGITSRGHICAQTSPADRTIMLDFVPEPGEPRLGADACAAIDATFACESVVARWDERRCEYRWDVGNGERRAFDIERVLHRVDSPFQAVEIVKTRTFGAALFIGGDRQSSEADEFVYHEMLVHPAMLRHPVPRRVLIAGGGEGAVAREVLRYGSVEKVIQVDIDSTVIDACKVHMPSLSGGAFDDRRYELQIGDARAFMAQTSVTFDVIVLDLPCFEPDSIIDPLFRAPFLSKVKERLAPGGLVAMQVGGFVHPVHLGGFTTVARQVAQVFEHRLFYVVPEICWGMGVFGVAPLQPQPPFDAGRVASRLRYYNEDIHKTLGALPTYVRDAMGI